MAETIEQAEAVKEETAAPEPEAEKAEATEAEGFHPITSQEQLDRIIAKRLERTRNKFADYDELKTRAAAADELKTRAEQAEEKLAGLEKANQVQQWRTAAAKEYGVPAEALRGADEKELKEHAKQLAELLTPANPVKKTIIPSEGELNMPLNGDPLLDKLKAALGAR